MSATAHIDSMAAAHQQHEDAAFASHDAIQAEIAARIAQRYRDCIDGVTVKLDSFRDTKVADVEGDAMFDVARERRGVCGRIAASVAAYDAADATHEQKALAASIVMRDLGLLLDAVIRDGVMDDMSQEARR